MADTAYENLIKLMQIHGAALNGASIEIGTMSSSSSLILGELNLSKDFLLFDSSLQGKLKKGDIVACLQVSDEYVAIISKLVTASGGKPEG